MNRKKLSLLQKLLRIELRHPKIIRDYCYQDQSPTDWIRQKQVYKEKTLEIKYICVSCETERYYINGLRVLRGFRK